MHPILFHIGVLVIPSYGVVAALGVLAALTLLPRTARLAQADPAKLWNLSILSLFVALAAARLLLVAANWSALRLHPAWLLGLAMIHHPLVAGVGALAGLACAFCYARLAHLSLAATADALASPIALGLAFEQAGALLAGSSWGVDASPRLPWAVTYSSPQAAIWSGVPLGVALHPVQAYAALAFLALAIALYLWLPRRRSGDLAGLGLVGAAVVIYLTEIWRDQTGRGRLLSGALDGPQIAAILLLLAGAWILRERNSAPPLTAPQADESQNRL